MWKTVKLGDIVTIEIGKTPARGNSKYWDEEMETQNVWLSIADLTGMNGRYIIDSKEYVSDEGAKLCKIVSKDTLIMSFKLSIGKLAFTGKDLYTNEAIAALSIKNENILSKEFLYHTLLSINWERLAGNDVKIKGKTLNKPKLKEVKLQLPPLALQQRIVAKLDAAFAEIDKAIAAVERNIENSKLLLECKKRSYFLNKATVTKSLLKDVCEATQGVQVNKANQKSELLEGYRRYLYISDFSHTKNMKYVKDEFPKKRVYTTDIIVVNTGATAGKIFRGIEGILSNNLFKVSPKIHLIDANFLFLFVNSSIFKRYQSEIMRGAANPHMGHQNFLSTPINLPKVEEQRAIIEKISILSKHTDGICDALNRKKAELWALKSVILAQELQSEAA